MPKCLDINAWRLSTHAEVQTFLGGRAPAAKSQLAILHKIKRYLRIPILHLFPQRPSPRQLIVRSQLKPVDVYAYLRARFGEPNGFQNFLRRNDSDNWIHWDFNLKSDDADIYIAGTSREIHFILSEPLTDVQWRDLIRGLKADFPRRGREKQRMKRSFEKFVVFQNKFVALADVCADLHAAIVDAPPFERYYASGQTKREVEANARAMKHTADRANALYGPCIKLALLTPVMAEAFLNLFILILCRRSILANRPRYEEFIRGTIVERLGRLGADCFGMARDVDPTAESYRAFLRVMNKRNFAIHGNVDPEREALETVYFEGTRPLFANSGDHIASFFEQLERLYSPETVIQDYLDVHRFLQDIILCLQPKVRKFFKQVIDDPYPGYEVKKKRVTKILPPYVVVGIVSGLRYDDQLAVTW